MKIPESCPILAKIETFPAQGYNTYLNNFLPEYALNQNVVVNLKNGGMLY